MPRALARRRSLVVWALLGLAMVLLSYTFILATAAVCVYLPYLLLANTESFNFQVLVLLLCGVAMAGAMVWSLVPRRDNFENPGPLIDRSSHPLLFAEMDQIADALNEPVPAEVFLIPQVNAFVSDRGGIMGFGSRRVMGIGLPLVAILNISEFRAVLAHEFAHYYSGDTRLGPPVYKTRQTIIRTMQNMSSLRGAMRIAIAQGVYRLVMWILQGYWILYFRATQIISRRQEYRADELACDIAGAESLIAGLKKIHGCGAAFPSYWNSEVLGFLNQGYRPAITEGFSLFVKSPEISRQIEDLLENELHEDKTNPYDSHPPLHKRITSAQRLVRETSISHTEAPATTLFSNLLIEEARLLSMSSSESAVAELKVVGWGDLSQALPKMWAEDIRSNGNLLSGLTPDDIPNLLPRLAEIGSRMPDPKGTLLSPNQRTQRAAELIGTALALLISNVGWPLRISPGERYFDIIGERFSVQESLAALFEKKTSREQWIELCQKMRIAGLQLVEAKASAAAANDVTDIAAL
jgi:heat shock protein HtpX